MNLNTLKDMIYFWVNWNKSSKWFSSFLIYGYFNKIKHVKQKLSNIKANKVKQSIINWFFI